MFVFRRSTKCKVGCVRSLLRSADATSGRKQSRPSLLLLTRHRPLFQLQRSYSKSACVLSQEQHAPRSATGLTLFNSLSSATESVLQDDTPKGLACYTCGPTVYAPAHLGHARTYVWLDILRRCLEHQAVLHQLPPPMFVLNITDVDDKILAAAKEVSEPPLELARRYESEFWEDWDALHCLRPHLVTRVTEHVDSDIVPYIARLVEQGMAYEISSDSDTTDGVYFDVRAYEEKMGKLTRYGKLAPPSSASDFFERHASGESAVAEGAHKRDPRDFVLWKKRKADEEMYWASPWGEGRPGWHIECSAMIEAIQSDVKDTHTFAMHAGGIDLKFPHHTNEIAQAEAYHCNSKCDSAEPLQRSEWIRHWVHTGHLHIDGLKMSKSLKNFVTVKELLADGGATEDDASSLSSSLASPADDFRLWCLGLSGSYRGKATYSESRMQESRNIRQKIVRFLVDGEEWLQRNGEISKPDANSTKKWSAEDHAFFTNVGDAALSSRRALLSDLDGSAYVKELVRIAEDGRSYLSLESDATRPVEPVCSALDTLRDLLVLVGFSESTSRAGLSSLAGSDGRFPGGERALLDELTRFRSKVRRIAIDEYRERKLYKNKQNDAVLRILALCDETRDKTFPAFGIEFLDRAVTRGMAEMDGVDKWKYCIPRSAEESEALKGPKPRPVVGLSGVPLEEYFKSGHYKGMFRDFDERGFPARHHDGKYISKTRRKKMEKKFEKHRKSLNKVVKKRERLEKTGERKAHHEAIRAKDREHVKQGLRLLAEREKGNRD